MWAYVIAPEDRAAFHRCRRQWDLGARARRNLEPRVPRPAPDLGRAVSEALAVYYFPGMWDWDRSVVLPLVVRGLVDCLERQRRELERRGAGEVPGERWRAAAEEGASLLERYFEWAPTVDRFSPVRVGPDFEVNIPDPARPGLELVLPDGRPVRYRGRIDLLVVDQHDAYWVMEHRLAEGEWADTEGLVADEDGVSRCWAWERFYPGMAIAGTIYNELRVAAGPGPEARPPGRSRVARRWGLRRRPRGRGIPQHEASGGGRSIPQHRRMYARAREPSSGRRIVQHHTDRFRRTVIRRTPAEVRAVGERIAREAVLMVDPALRPHPTPSPEHCPACPFLRPCTAMDQGGPVAAILEAEFRVRPEAVEEGRLGGTSWGMGRGAAPPRFREARPPP